MVVEWATETFLLQQETVSHGDLLLTEKFNLPVSDYFCRLFSPHLYLFLPDPISFRNVLQPLKIFSGLCQENVFFHVCSFRRLFSPLSHFAN